MLTSCAREDQFMELELIGWFHVKTHAHEYSGQETHNTGDEHNDVSRTLSQRIMRQRCSEERWRNSTTHVLSIASTMILIAFLLMSAGSVLKKPPLAPRTAFWISSRDKSGRTSLRPSIDLFKKTAPEMDSPSVMPSS